MEMLSIYTATGRPVMYVLLSVRPLLSAVALSPSTSVSISAFSTPGFAMHLARIPGAPRGVGSGCRLRAPAVVYHQSWLSHSIRTPSQAHPETNDRIAYDVYYHGGNSAAGQQLSVSGSPAQAGLGRRRIGRYTSCRLAVIRPPVDLLLVSRRHAAPGVTRGAGQPAARGLMSTPHGVDRRGAGPARRPALFSAEQ